MMSIIAGLYFYAHKLLNFMSHQYYKSKIRGNVDSLSIKGRSHILYPEGIKVGKNCCINDSVIMHCVGGVRLGDNVTISTGAKLITRSYDTLDWRTQCQVDEPEMKHISDEISLADHTWVGAGATILPGVKITGKGVIVAAGSVVTKDVDEDFVLIGGGAC